MSPASRRRPGRWPAPLLLLTLLGTGCFSACPTAEDAAARERIWGPEEPPEAEVAARETLDISALSTDASLRRRILWMSAAEMAHRLGSFSADNQIKMRWRRGDQKVKLDESMVLQQAASGEFRVASENDADLGMELRWVAGVVYVKNRGGKFFERRADRAAHLAWREAAMEQLATALTLARGKIALAELGATTHEGRGARRFVLTSATDPVPGSIPPERPAWAHDPIYPEDGPGETLRHRLAVMERGELDSVSGDLVVDTLTGVPLRFSIHLKLHVPAPEPGPDDEAENRPPATLDLKISRRVVGIGAEQLIARPEHQPFSTRPRALMDPLAWWPPAVEAKARAAKEKKEAAEAKNAAGT